MNALKLRFPGSATSPARPDVIGSWSAALGLAGIWLGMRVFSSLWVALISPVRPLTEVEKLVALWPPSSPIGVWLDRVLYAPWLRWDAAWYMRIVTGGYQASDGTAQFHPLYPWLAALLFRAGLHPMLSLLLVSSAVAVLLLVAFERLASQDLSQEDARASTLLFLFFPLGWVLFAPYTEGLFLLCSILCLAWARRRAWWLAGLAGGLAALTRQQGVFLLLPLAWEVWEASGRNTRQALQQWEGWLGSLLVPAGMLAWLVYRALALGDLHANLSSPQALIFSLLISPSTSKVVTISQFLWPWQTLGLAFQRLAQYPANPDMWSNLVLGAIFLIYLAAGWKSLRTSYRIYILATFLAAFSYYTGPVHPLMGFPRHLYLAFPIFIGLSLAMKNKWLRVGVVGAGLLGMMFLLMLYVLEGWVP